MSRKLDVNTLAGVLTPQLKPGQDLEVLIAKSGEGRNQGIGFLEDGSMVVGGQPPGASPVHWPVGVTIESSPAADVGQVDPFQMSGAKLRRVTPVMLALGKPRSWGSPKI